MKITGFETTALKIPVTTSFVGSVKFECFNPVVVELFTDEGLRAHGLAMVFNNFHVKLLKDCIDALANVVVGADLERWAQNWDRLWKLGARIGSEGLGVMAVSAIDMALWNLRAKSLEMPLARLLGGYRDEVPVYASNYLWRDRSIDELQKEAASLVEQGFKAVKMRMGWKSRNEEVKRLAAVREAVGPDVDIMVDVLWVWTVYESIVLGREMEKMGVYWLEDPIPTHDVAGLSEIARSLDMPLVVGENVAHKRGFRRLFEERATDIAMIDVQAVGGVTEWMKVAAMAEAYNLPVVSHLFDEFSVHLVAAIPNGVWTEHMPWWEVIYNEPPQPKDGWISVPNVPGIGYELNRDAMKRFRM
ncbi:MAG TPA: mandelate racemase/muconate lactonizing enzyme family protein [Dehalococcoidia bacterium]|nr:mandelate racemase/muconate lactonizing enzyme family protein [Dehalococcoidia bacterium]